MRINFENKLSLIDSYMPVKDSIKGELNQKLAKHLINLFVGYSRFVVEKKNIPNFWDKYTVEKRYTRLIAWRMLLDPMIPFQYYEAEEREFGDNNGYDEGDFEDEFYFDNGVMLSNMISYPYTCDAIVITYELFINYVVLLRNKYELELEKEGVEKEVIEKEMQEIDELIANYCKRYNVEVKKDFYEVYENLSDYVLMIVNPKEFFEGIEMSENIYISTYEKALQRANE